MPGSSAQAVDVSTLAAASGPVFVAPNGTYIRGFSVYANGAACFIRIREKSATGKILLTLPLASGDYQGEGHMNLRCNGDVYVQFVSGTAAALEGSIWIA